MTACARPVSTSALPPSVLPPDIKQAEKATRFLDLYPTRLLKTILRMAQNRPENTENDIDLTPGSTLHMTLSLGDPRADITSIVRSTPFSLGPSYQATLTERARVHRNSNTVEDMREPEFEPDSECGTIRRTTSDQASLSDAEEADAALFGENFPYTRTDGSQATRAMYACDPASVNRSKRQSDSGYNAATESHFRQHLNVLDFRGSQPSRNQSSIYGPGHVLQDDQTQIMLLEAQNKKRLMQARMGLPHGMA